jgi:hypothetical protein
MKPYAFALLGLAAALPLFPAGPAERLAIAAMKLSEAPNYSWRSHVEDDAGGYYLEGKNDGRGTTWVRLPMVGAIAQRLGRNDRDGVEVYCTASNAAVLRIGDTWKTFAEVPVPPSEKLVQVRRPVVRGSVNNNGAFTLPGGQLATIQPLLIEPHAKPRPYSSARLGISHPHNELAILVSCATDLQLTGEVVTGTLSDTGAALLLISDEQRDVVPLAAAGAFKLWLNAGAVVKYQVRLEALLEVNKRKTPAHVLATTVLNDVGSTRVLVPDEARFKLNE